MSKTKDRELADYFGVSERLLPHVGELLADFSELGSDPQLVCSWLDAQNVNRGSRVLDLGCGKGAVSVRVARELDCTVDGIDAYAPFIAEATKRAEQLGVASLCRFVVRDLKEAVNTARGYDAVLFIAVGGVLGSLSEAVGLLRGCVRPGGVMIVDDAYRLTKRVDFPGYEYMLGRDETLAELTAHGDRIITEELPSVEATQAQNSRYQAWIEQRAEALAAREPALANDLAAYVDKERQECAVLERDVQCATWMIERTSE